MHVRTRIRDAVAAAVTGLPTTGNRVEVERERQLAAGHEPTLLIYVGPESSERDAAARPPILRREIELVVEARASGLDDPQATLDVIAEEVEMALALNYLGGLVWDLALMSTDPVINANGERVAGARRMTWRARYRTPEGQPRISGSSS